MSGEPFRKPKLMVSNRGGTCAMCAEEFDPGFPIWWLNGRAYCAHHNESEIMTEGPAEPSPSPAPVTSQDTRFWMSEIDRMTRIIGEAIAEQTRIIERLWGQRP